MGVQSEKYCRVDCNLELRQIHDASKSTTCTRTPKTKPKRTPTNTQAECFPLPVRDVDRCGFRRSLHVLWQTLSVEGTRRSLRNRSRGANQPPSKHVDRRELFGFQR